MSGHRVVVVGDALLDRDVEGAADRLAPDAPAPVLEESGVVSRPGGAALAAALLAADGAEVTLVSALARDGAGRELAALLDEAGVRVVDCGLAGSTPEKVRLSASGRLLLRLDRGGGPAGIGPPPPAARQAIAEADALLVSDYGRHVAALAALRAAADLGRRRLPLVWDPHPSGATPWEGVTLATPNRAEVGALVRRDPSASEATGNAGTLAPLVAAARDLRAQWRAGGLAVTLGRDGALLVDSGGTPLVVPTEPLAASVDACGAGDRFAAALARALAAGALPSEAVVAAVEAATRFVAAGGAAGYARRTAVPRAAAPEPAAAVPRTCDAIVLADDVRRSGGTVVATGGCFDLLHAGHVALLSAARQLGDCLVVCLNSDASVRRLKGPGRPLVPGQDRAAVLLALDCVDAVAVFDDDTPDALLERVRPHVFAKGGDYTGARIPERATVSRWGGETVLLPYLAGRSTTGIVARALTRSRAPGGGRRS